MKFNMGCGFNKLSNFVNVDKFSECSPDLKMDLEQFPWPIKDDSADEIVFNHCLEHLGQETKVFLKIMQEIYRISKSDAKIIINVPHPRHDHFMGDPTHVRVISPLVLSLFSKENNLCWKKAGSSNSPLAIYLNVDFEVTEYAKVLDPFYQSKFNKKELSAEQLDRLSLESNNVIQEYKFVLRVVK